HYFAKADRARPEQPQQARWTDRLHVRKKASQLRRAAQLRLRKRCEQRAVHAVPPKFEDTHRAEKNMHERNQRKGQLGPVEGYKNKRLKNFPRAASGLARLSMKRQASHGFCSPPGQARHCKRETPAQWEVETTSPGPERSEML